MKKPKIWTKLPEKIQKTASVVSAITLLFGTVVGITTWGIDRVKARIDERVAHAVNRIEEHEKKLDTVYGDMRLSLARLELLNLISDYPDEKTEILKAAEYYFCTLGGDFTATHMFEDWARTHGVSSTFVDNCRN